MSKQKSVRYTAATEVYPLISLEELESREQKLNQRLHDIRLSSGYFQEARESYLRILAEEIKQTHWDRYVSCNGLPKPQSPQHIRNFIEKNRHFEIIHSDTCINWTLAVVERSVLSQNVIRKDLTRRTLEEGVCPEIGEFYSILIRKYLATLDLMDDILTNEEELVHMDMRRAMEIVELHRCIEQEIRDVFNRFIYRIISKDCTYLGTTDGIIAEFSHQSDDFRLHIWTLRDVPIRFKHLDLPLMVADMHGVEVKIQLPLSVLHDCLTVACVHVFFDHLSVDAKSFVQIITKNTNDIIAGLPDMQDATIREWLLQLEVLEETKKKMEENYGSYVENMKHFNEKTAQSAKENKDRDLLGGKKKKKVLKAPKEPPYIPDNMYPDTFSLFQKNEEEQFKDIMNEFFHPDTLKLQPDEINLKKYMILGGNYTICFVRKPKFKDYDSIKIGTHEKAKKLYILKDLMADVNFEKKKDVGVEASAHTLKSSKSKINMKSRSQIELDQSRPRIMTEPIDLIDIDKSIMLGENEVPFIILTFKLPQYLCMFGTPIVCQFIETDVELEEVKILPTELIFSQNQRVKEDVDSAKSLRRLTSIKRRETESQNIFRTSLGVHLRYTLLPLVYNDAPDIPNFSVRTTLTKHQMRNIERFCVPRIISSFKFPTEMKEAAMEAFQLKKKQKLQNILTRRTDPEIFEPPDIYLDFEFNFEDQTNPERLFPVFPEQEQLPVEDLFDDPDSDMEELCEPNSFYGVLKTFREINQKYVTHYKKIMDQNIFVGKQPKKSQPAVESLVEIATETPRQKSKLMKPKVIVSTTKIPVKTITDEAVQRQSTSTLNLDEHADPNNPESSNLPENDEQSTSNVKMGKVKSWSTKYIYETIVNKNEFTITVKTDRLGIFGFAYERYEHFPFRNWVLKPDDVNPAELLFTLDTQHVRVVINISGKGYRGYVTDVTTKFVAHPVKYLEIEKPISIDDLKTKLLEKNFNIFSEPDAFFYINKGYFSQKHWACENHIYDTMALHCMLLQFYYSQWNRLSTYRNIALCMRNAKEIDDDSSAVTVRITPENATFVEIKEMCSDDLDVIRLNYIPTWRNISSYSDLHQLITSMYPQANDIRNRDALLINSLKTFLNEIRPLSYS